jgi:P pilus assembly chaperone PapD
MTTQERKAWPHAYGWVLMVLMALLSSQAMAFNYTVSPIHAELAPRQRSTELTVKSNSTKAVLLRVKVMEWRKQDGEDVLTPAKGMIATPPLLRLESKQSQKVRFGLISPRPQGAPEAQYRVVFEEVEGGSVALPQGDGDAATEEPKPNIQMSIATLTNISLPLIVRSQNKQFAAQVSARWAAAAPGDASAAARERLERLSTGEPRALVLDITNTGSSTEQLRKLSLIGPDQQLIAESDHWAWVLPGQMSRVRIEVPEEASLRGAQLRARAGQTALLLPIDFAP